MADDKDSDQAHRPDRPRSEPEIIPPQRNRAGADPQSHIWVSVDEQGGTQRIYLARPGPFAIIAALAVIGLVVAAIVLVLLGAMLIWIPVVIFIISALLLRHYWHRLQSWLARR
jgi:hypothetical protein